MAFCIFGVDAGIVINRTDLRKAVSGAKFDAESDFEVHFAVAPPKSIKNDEKPISDTKKISIFFVFLMFLVPPSFIQSSNFDDA